MLQRVSSQSWRPRIDITTRGSRGLKHRAYASPPLFYVIESAPGHDKPNHPETPGRIAAISTALRQHGLHAHDQVTQLHAADTWPPRPDVMAALQLVHPAGYLKRVQEICNSLQEPAMIDESTYIAPGSWTACIQTAAAVLNMLEVVLAGSTGSSGGSCGVCLVRPPGHHVLPTRPMGFGLFNFIAMAARHALTQQHHAPVRKVLIVDFDVHHGNGTEEIFYKDDAVLYISTHQQGLWPYTGKVTQCGAGTGAGYTINLPLPGGSGHQVMQMVLDQVIYPAAHRFQPDLLLVSAGLQFQSKTYHMLFKALTQLSNELRCGCMFITEGGYDQESLAESVVESFLGVLDQPALHSLRDVAGLQTEPLEKVQDLLSRARTLHRLQ